MTTHARLWQAQVCAGVMCVFFVAGSTAQERGSLSPKPPAPTLSADEPGLPAKQLFGGVNAPAPLQARAIGFYSRGCLAGAQALPVDGETWQVMRLSRNRNWGHPKLVRFLEDFAHRVPAINGWPGILVGDIAQPRGGPMLTGHASHQIGLDADVWLTPMPPQRLSRLDREDMTATDVVAANQLDVDRSKWTSAHMALIRAAAQSREVERIFVNPAIKKAICRDAQGDRSWLNKVRPMYGHNYHFHIRIACPEGQAECREQDPTPPGDGCDASLAWWFTYEVLHPKRPAHPAAPLTLAQLPPECRTILLSR
jgi:penicillin-insensitive murein endopeptidase